MCVCVFVCKYVRMCVCHLGHVFSFSGNPRSSSIDHRQVTTKPRSVCIFIDQIKIFEKCRQELKLRKPIRTTEKKSLEIRK